MSLNAVSKQLRLLERAGLIRRRIQGREHHCSLEADPLRELASWTERYRGFWEKRIDALEGYLRARRAPRTKGRRGR